MNIKGLISFLIAIVGAAAFLLIISFTTNAVYTPIKGNGGGYTLPVPEVAQATSTPTEQPKTPTDQPTTTAEQPTEPTSEPVAELSFAALLASATVEDGKKVSRKCSACHSLKEGGKTMVGPALWDIIGHNIASTEGFKYSTIFQEIGTKGDVWGYENLNEFLTSPKTFAPKTKMTFSGIKKAEDRAALLVYLQSLSNDPVPLPVE